MNEDQVDFSQVKWEDVPQSQSVDTQDIDWSTVKWEDVPPPQPATVWDRPSMSSLNKIRSAFADPKAFSSAVGLDEHEGMKQALTAYYANGKPEKIPGVYNTLDTHIKEFHGKPLSVEQAYGEIANIFNAKPETYKPEVSAGTKIEFAARLPFDSVGAIGSLFKDSAVQEQAAALTAAGFANLAGLFPEMGRIVTKAALNLPVSMMGKDTESEENMSGFKEIGKAFTDVPTLLIKDNKDFLKEMAGIYDQNADKDVIDTFKSQGAAAAAEKMLKEAFVAIPELGLLIASGPYAIPLIGATSGTRKYNELDMNNPDVSEGNKQLNALAVGLVTMVTFKLLTYDKVLGMGIGPKIGAAVKEGLIPALTDFTKKFIIQTGQMDIVAAAEHAVNTMTNVENPKDMFNTILNTTVSCAPLNLGFAAMGSAHFAKSEAVRAKVKNTLESRANEISAKGENATDKEILELRKIQTDLESRDMDAVIRRHGLESMVNAINQDAQERAGKSKESPETDELDTANRSHLDDEEAAADALRNYQQRESFQHHPDDTIATVQKIKELDPKLPVEVARSREDLPPEVKTRMENSLKSQGHDGVPRAFYNGGEGGDGKIYVLADQVKPQDVPLEILGEMRHKGLLEIFGKEKLAPYFDYVSKTYGKEVEDFVTRKQYGFDLGTVDGMRDAAHEFIVHTAKFAEKPAFWKDLINRFKIFMRGVGWLKDARLTDSEVASLLAGAVGKKGRNVGEMKFAVDSGKTLREIENKLPKLNSSGKLNHNQNKDDLKKQAREVFDNFPDTVQDKDGLTVYLIHNRQGEDLFDHLTTKYDKAKNTSNFDSIRTSWVPLIPRTIQNAEIKLDAGDGRWFYIGKYDNGFRHLVLVDMKGELVDQEVVGDLWTHFSEKIGDVGKHSLMRAHWLGKLSPHAMPGSEGPQRGSEGTSPDKSLSAVPDSTGNQSPEKSSPDSNLKFSLGKFDFNKQIDDHIKKKYPELYKLPEDFELKVMPQALHEKIQDNTLKPKELDEYFSKLMSDELPAAIEDAKALLADKFGDLAETYRYEGEKDGQTYEKYIDSLYRRVKAVEKSLSGKTGKDSSASDKADQSFVSAVPDNSGIDSSSNTGDSLSTVLFSLTRKERSDLKDMEAGTVVGMMKEELGDVGWEKLRAKRQRDMDKGTSRKEDYGIDTYIDKASEIDSEVKPGMAQSDFIDYVMGVEDSLKSRMESDRIAEDAYWQAQEEENRKLSGTYYSDAQKTDMADFLRPLVSKLVGVFPDPQVAYDTLKKAGFKIHSVSDAQTMLKLSQQRVSRKNSEVAKVRKNKWMSREYPIVSRMLKEFGDKVKIKPSTEYIKDIDFDNAGQGAGDFLQKRGGKNTLSSAEVARKLNVDEEDLLDALKNLTSKKINESYKAYTDGKKEKSKTFSKMYEEVQKQRDFGMAVDIAQGKKNLDDIIITERKGVAKEVYEQVMGEPMPKEPHWDAVRAKIAEDYPDNVEKMKADAESAKADMPDKLEEVITAITQRAEFNIEKLQAILKDYARTAIPDANLAKSIGEDIKRLTEYSSQPTTAFPEGRQSAMLEDVLQKIIGAKESIDKSNMLQAIDDLLDRTNLRRVGKGRVVSVYADAQKELDEIRGIRSMSSSTILKLIEYHQAEADKLINLGQDASEHQRAGMMAETFGMLDEKSPEQLADVFRQTDQLARHGRSQLKQFLAERKAVVDTWRMETENLVTGGKGLMLPQELAKIEAKRKTFGKDSVLQAQDLEMLLSWITRNSKIPFQETMMYKEFFKRVHQAFQDKTTGVRQRREVFESEINRIFGTSGARSRAKVMGELKEQVETSGVFRFQRDPNNKEGIKYKKLAVDDARALLAEYDSTGKGLSDYQAEAVRQRLADLDEHLKDAVKSRTGDEFTDDIFNALLSENDKNVVNIPEIVNPGELKEHPLSQLQALYYRLCWDQSTVRYKMAFNGWTKESIAQLDKFIRPEVRELGKYMVADLAKDFPNIQEVYKKLYMTTMKGNEGYFPTSYNVQKEIAAANSAEMGNLYSGQMSITPGTLSARKFHLMEPKAEDAVSIYMRHVLQMEHFKTHAETARDLRSLFNSRDVGNAIRQYYGPDVQNYLKLKIEDFVNGGRLDAQHEAILDSIQSVFARTRIWWNSVSMIKQMAGGGQYINDIPVSAFFSGIADFVKSPIQNMNMLRETDYFKNRWAGSIDRDIGLIISKHRYSAEEGANFFSQLDEIGSIPTRFGDAFSVIVGGHAVYKYHYDNLIKNGMDSTEAHKRALQEWELSTERTQQSGAVHKMNRYQLDSSFSRTWTTFQSNPILIANAFIEAAMDVKANRGLKGAAYAKLARRATTAWIIGGLVMSVISQAAKNGGDLDEYELDRIMKDTLLGPFSSFTFLGYGIDAAANAVFGIRENNSRSIDDIGNSVRSGIKLTSGDFDDDEVWKLVEKGLIGIGGVGVAGVPGVKPFAPAAIHGAGIMRELRRYYNLFAGSKK